MCANFITDTFLKVSVLRIYGRVFVVSYVQYHIIYKGRHPGLSFFSYSHPFYFLIWPHFSTEDFRYYND